MNQSIDLSQILSGIISQASGTKSSQTGNSGNDFSSMLQGLMKGKNFSSTKGVSEKAGCQEGYACSGRQVIDSLKKAIIANGNSDFETSGIDAAAIARIGDLLEMAGASDEKISSVISSITARINGGKVSLEDVFAELDTLEDSDFFKSGFFLEVSSIPYLETLLAQMGLNTASAKSVIDSATDIENGINVGKLAKALKALDANAFRDSDGAVPGENLNFRTTAEILEQIGLQTESNDKNGSMSLGRLITLLEKNVEGTVDQSETQEKNSLARLMNILSGSAGTESALSSLNSIDPESGTGKKADLEKLIKALSKDSTGAAALSALNSTGSNISTEEKAALEKLMKALSKDSTGAAALSALNSTGSNISTEEKAALEKLMKALSKDSSGTATFAALSSSGLNSDTEKKAAIEKLLNSFSKNSKTGSENNEESVSASPDIKKVEYGINGGLFTGQTAGELFSEIVNSVKTISGQTNATVADSISSQRVIMAKIQLEGNTDKTTEITDDINGVSKDKAGKAASKSAKNTQEYLSASSENQESNKEKAIEQIIPETIIETESIEKRSSETRKNTDFLKTAAGIHDAVSSGGSSVSETPSAEQTVRSPLPVYVTNQAAKGILRAIGNNEKEITINIKPPELGRMQIKIENTEAGMKVQIIAEKNMTSDILNSSKNDIAAYLADSGIRVEKLDIQLSFNFDQAASSLKDQAQQDSGRRKNRKNEENSREETAGNSSMDDEDIMIDDRVSLTA